MPEISLDSVIVAKNQQVSADLEGEAVILDLDRGFYYGLNTVGAQIWALVQEPRSLTEVRDRILQDFDVDPDRCETDLLALVGQLAERELIEVQDPRPAPS